MLKIKEFLASILDFTLFSNVFIGLCAAAQVMVTYQLLDLQPDGYILAFVFLSTLIIYNLSMLLAKPADPHKSPLKRVRWIFSHHRLVVSITLISVLAIIPIGLFYLGMQAKILMVFTGVIACAYNFPFLILNNKKIGLRHLPGVKLFLIAIVWAVSVVVLPIVQAEGMYNIKIPATEMFLLAAKRFLFIAAITIPFDIRDLFQDKLYELKTIPVIIGERKARMFCLGLLVLYLFLLLLFSQSVNMDVIALTTSLLLTAWLIFRSDIKKDEYYYFLYLDGTMIVQFILLYAVSFSQH